MTGVAEGIGVPVVPRRLLAQYGGPGASGRDRRGCHKAELDDQVPA